MLTAVCYNKLDLKLAGYEEAARQSAGVAAGQSVRNKPGCRLHEPGSSGSSPDGNIFIDFDCFLL